jgi:hypothetical protein
MKPHKIILTLYLLLGACGAVLAQAPAGDGTSKSGLANTVVEKEGTWLSYRDAYKVMLRFEKYGKPKNLIQHHLQIRLRDKADAGGDEFSRLRLRLVSASLRLELPIDASGRVALPLLKSAYDENAELIFNQKLERVQVLGRITVVTRADGIYEVADLRAACEQALAYESFIGNDTTRDKKCIGVRFVYGKKESNLAVELRSAERAAQNLLVADGSAFSGDTNDFFKTITYNFSNGTEKIQLITRSAPILIAPLFN